jgi:hypothetical protein
VTKLKYDVKLIKDLKRQHQINSYRFYTSESQAILLELISEEIDKWPLDKLIPLKLFSDLSNPEKLATNSIEKLCLLYREVIISANYAVEGDV